MPVSNGEGESLGGEHAAPRGDAALTDAAWLGAALFPFTMVSASETIVHITPVVDENLDRIPTHT